MTGDSGPAAGKDAMLVRDPEGATLLAVSLLADGAAIPDATRAAGLLKQAACEGSARASAMLANLAAAGIGRPPDWNEALDHLQRAAEGGFEPARAQLALLAQKSLDEAAAGRWARLRAAVDMQAWVTLPPKRSLSEDPRIRVLEGFIGPAVCEWMIRRAEGRLARARVYDARAGDGAVHHARTNRETDFNIVESDLVLLALRARMAAAAGLPPAVLELTKVLHYSTGEAFEPHFDFIDPAVPGFAQELSARGQRLATLLVYLNENYGGGETDFVELGIRYKGRRGDALLFANVDRGGAPDRRTLHAGRPPLTGEKWLLSQWMRDRTPAAS